MPVYFIRAGETGPVKIGTAGNVRWRLAELQMGHYEQLHLIREVEGGRLVEAWLHREFRQYHRRGEWFDFALAMLNVSPPALVDKRGRRGRASVEEFLRELATHEAAEQKKIVNPFPLISNLEDLGAARNISVDRLCRMASINRATWQRIKAGTCKPSFDTLTSLNALHRELGGQSEPKAA